MIWTESPTTLGCRSCGRRGRITSSGPTVVRPTGWDYLRQSRDYLDPADRQWLNPNHPAVRAYLQTLHDEIRAGLDVPAEPDDLAEFQQRLQDICGDCPFSAGVR